MKQSLVSMGIDGNLQASLFSLVSGVLMLGNVDIGSEFRDGVPDAAHLSACAQTVLHDACALLFLDASRVEAELLTKTCCAGTETIRGPWRCCEARVLRDSLAKVRQNKALHFCSVSSHLLYWQAIFEKLFEWIVLRLNAAIAPPEGFNHFLGQAWVSLVLHPASVVLLSAG